MLRRTLDAAHYRSHGWAMGRNLAIRRVNFHGLDRRMDYIQRHDPQPVSLIGCSLGGLIALEHATYAPDRVAKVSPLGSPFAGDLRTNNDWRIYELEIGREPV